MTLRKIYGYFINPMLVIFLIPSLFAYFKEEQFDYGKQLIIAILGGLVLGCIYMLWDNYKSKKRNQLNESK